VRHLKKYIVTKTYSIQAEDDLQLHAILRTGELNAIERYRTQQDIKLIPKRAKKKGWQLWVAAVTRQLKYLVIGQ
jgi:hypothetical protein